jgi:hypothetical protein
MLINFFYCKNFFVNNITHLLSSDPDPNPDQYLRIRSGSGSRSCKKKGRLRTDPDPQHCTAVNYDFVQLPRPFLN